MNLVKRLIQLAHSYNARLVLPFAAALVSGPAAALEVTGGDYEAFPPGNVLIFYYQHADRSDFYANGQKLSDNFRLLSEIGIVRYIRVVKLSENAIIDPQLILLFGSLKSGGEASFLGNASGTADLMVGAPIIAAIIRVRYSNHSLQTISLRPFWRFYLGLA